MFMNVCEGIQASPTIDLGEVSGTPPKTRILTVLEVQERKVISFLLHMFLKSKDIFDLHMSLAVVLASNRSSDLNTPNIYYIGEMKLEQKNLRMNQV